jgi:hypothetical protein
VERYLRGVGPDTEGHGPDERRGEASVARKHPQRPADVLPHFIEEAPSTVFVVMLFDARAITERAPGFDRPESGVNAVFGQRVGFQREVRIDLGLEVVGGAPFRHDSELVREHAVDGAGHALPA